ncbi:protein of unknown function [Methylocaldum szegediense]|uniref:Uncharacterized protein n=1 Tax=Methylocaldum szegediense TaxID=73780 RepID=A0ABN8X5T2_9GAMM|nr:protein of unknown function [Methylocaldum szegediense]
MSQFGINTDGQNLHSIVLMEGGKNLEMRQAIQKNSDTDAWGV